MLAMSLARRVLGRFLWQAGLIQWSKCREIPVGAHGDRLVMCDCHGRDQVVTKILAEGWQSFEQPLPSVLRQLISRGPCAYLDVGANTGFYSLLAALSGASEVRAFEPLPSARRILKRNLRCNAARHQTPVSVFPCALSDQGGLMSLFLPLQGHGLVETSASLNSSFKAEHGGVLRVKTTTVDKHLAEFPLETALQLIIKIDAEGGERQVLEGARKTIRARRPWLIVEILPPADREFFEVLARENRYRLLPLRESIEPEELDRWPEDSPCWNFLLLPAERNPSAFIKFK
jgi:FkbM family methyltransferase